METRFVQFLILLLSQGLASNATALSIVCSVALHSKGTSQALQVYVSREVLYCLLQDV